MDLIQRIRKNVENIDQSLNLSLKHFFKKMQYFHSLLSKYLDIVSSE